MRRPRRKLLCKFHLRTGWQFKVACRDITTRTTARDVLLQVNTPGGRLPHFFDLNEVVLITYRRSWLRWGWW